MITDSFGSPSLGEGIALQAQPKDYSGQIVKGIIAGQERKAKAEQKKLDQDLANQEKLNTDLARFKVTGGIPAFTPEYARISDEFMKTVSKLKSEGKPVTSSMEYLEAKAKAEQQFQNLKTQEDMIMPALTKMYSGINPDEEEIDEEFSNALKDPSGNQLRAMNNGQIGLPQGRGLITKTPKIDILKYASQVGSFIKPKEDLLTQDVVKQYQGVNDKAAFIESVMTKIYDPNEIKNATDQFLNSSEMLIHLNREAKRAVRYGASFDRAAEIERQKSLFESQFKNVKKEQLRQLFESKANSLSAGGAQPNKLVNLIAGTTDNLEFIKSTAYPNYLTNLKNQPYIKAIWGKLDVDENTSAADFEKAVLKYNENEKKEGGFPIPFQTVDSLNEQYTSLTGGRKATYFSRTDSALNKDFRLNKGKQSYDAQPKALVENKDGSFSFLAEALIDAKIKDPSTSKDKIVKVRRLMEFPFSQNANVIGSEFGLDEKAWIEWHKTKQEELKQTGSGTGSKNVQIKKEGGLVEPKEISKRFHDKSRNMTKFVYSDGAEEIFKGLL